MDDIKKQLISYEIIKVLKTRFDSFPENTTFTRNAPFHKAFLQAFQSKFTSMNANTNVLITISSWLHGLNTTLGQSFFEKVAHILSCGQKKTFKDNKIYEAQAAAILDIMTDLKNAIHSPSIEREESIIAATAHGNLVNAPDFTADCFFEDSSEVVAIELKSVRPNSGEMRGEKQKILMAKAVLKAMYPNKAIHYFVGFPFDPCSETDTGFNKAKFMSSVIELTKFLDPNEILLSEELWTFLSGEDHTMQTIIDLIEDISQETFYDDFAFLCSPHSAESDTARYRKIIIRWHLIDELLILNHWKLLTASANQDVEKYINASPFDENGNYHFERSKTLIKYIQNNL